MRVRSGPATFVGELEELQVVLMQVREPTAEHKATAHVLPPDFDTSEVRTLCTVRLSRSRRAERCESCFESQVFGDMFLVRMDKTATPQNFTLAEYHAYLKSKGVKLPRTAADSEASSNSAAAPAAAAASASSSSSSSSSAPSNASASAAAPPSKKQRSKK